MKTATKYFGEIEYEEEKILHFPEGLFGFEEEKRFLLLPFSGDGTLLCLQSLQTPGLAFIVMDPFSLCPDYTPVLQPEELRCMQAEDSKQLFFYVLCVVKNPVGDSTVNLKCPVAINGETREARQFILDGNTYGMRHPLSGFSDDRQEEASC